MQSRKRDPFNKYWLVVAGIGLCLNVALAYVLQGFQWPVGSNVGYVINANTTQVSDEAGAVRNAGGTWGAVYPPGLRLSYRGSTSLTGRQYNGTNSISWVHEGNSGALATSYTWYSGGTILETDMVFNDYYTWSTSGSHYDIETVALHEFGHWVGLGHSNTGIMRPSYSGIQRSIGSDAIAGFMAMYGGAGDEPVIEVDKHSLAFTGKQIKIFGVRNSGADTLNYQAGGDRSWISVYPTAGTSDGEWDDIQVQVETAGLGVGEYSGAVRVTSNNAVNSPVEVGIRLSVVDDKPPLVRISSPGNDDVVSGIVPVSAFASDDHGVKRVEFFLDGVLKGSDAASPYLWNWNTAGVGSGFHTIAARAVDTRDQNAQDSIRVKVDQPPSVRFVSPAAGTEVTGMVTVNASASDDVGVKEVRFYINGILQLSDKQSPYSFSWDTSEYLNGFYTLKATAYDTSQQSTQSLREVYRPPHVPVEITGRKYNNSSTLLEQYINEINWQAHSRNADISGYRIYKIQTNDRVLWKELGVDNFSCREFNVDKDSSYRYAVHAVDIRNREGEAGYVEIR